MLYDMLSYVLTPYALCMYLLYHRLIVLYLSYECCSICVARYVLLHMYLFDMYCSICVARYALRVIISVTRYALCTCYHKCCSMYVAWYALCSTQVLVIHVVRCALSVCNHKCCLICSVHLLLYVLLDMCCHKCMLNLLLCTYLCVARYFFCMHCSICSMS